MSHCPWLLSSYLQVLLHFTVGTAASTTCTFLKHQTPAPALPSLSLPRAASHITHTNDKSVAAPCLFPFDRENCSAQWMALSLLFLFKDSKILCILCVVLFCLKECLFTTCVLGTCAQKKARDSLGTGVRMVGEPPCRELWVLWGNKQVLLTFPVFLTIFEMESFIVIYSLLWILIPWTWRISLNTSYHTE